MKLLLHLLTTPILSPTNEKDFRPCLAQNHFHGMFSRWYLKTDVTFCLYLIFFSTQELIMPTDAASSAKKMELPGVLVINEQYFIKVDNMTINLPGTVQLLQEAIANLFVYYYVLGLNYSDFLNLIFYFLKYSSKFNAQV